MEDSNLQGGASGGGGGTAQQTMDCLRGLPQQPAPGNPSQHHAETYCRKASSLGLLARHRPNPCSRRRRRC